MFGLLKNKKQKDAETVHANDFLDPVVDENNQDEIETELSIPSDWKLTNEDRYVYAYHNNESPKLKLNQVSIYGIELSKLKNKSFVATGLIRNTVPKAIRFGSTTILLLGPNQEPFAKKEFDLSKLGSIPANGARPWKFTFAPDDIMNDVEKPVNDWSLAFEIKKKHQLDLEESWEQSIAEEAKSSLQAIVANAQQLKPGEVNFMGLKANRNENNDLVVTILIRNGADKNMTLQQVPLAFKDASDVEVARGNFKLEDFKVKANTSKPWTFVFPTSSITKDEIDLSKWKVYAIQN